MRKSLVAIVRYEKPGESVRKAVELSHGLDQVPAKAKVFIKPNIVFWSRVADFPKWGVITTSRVIEDMVVLLKARGIDDIAIGEGMVTQNRKDKETPADAFERLGYNALKQRYGVKPMNIFDRPFEEVDLGAGVVLNYNSDMLHSDFVVNVPVLKTHAQTIVSLGIKNLKGLLDIPSRKKCHGADPVKDLHYWMARLPNKLPPSLTILDGIYTKERGPSFDGPTHRSNLLVASTDLVSADMVGAKVLGHEPADVPYLVHAASDRGRPTDLSDVEVVGETIEAVASPHQAEVSYSTTDEGEMPVPLAKKGIKGLYYRKYDLSMCTYCSGINGTILGAVLRSWLGEPWDDVEVLTGKVMQPTPGRKKTILLGKCMYDLHKDNPDIREMIAVRGCPPAPKAILKAFHEAGIQLDPAVFDNMDLAPTYFLKRYEGKPEFDDSFFAVA
jgi:uncharacterized protein (DUF362 family)